MEASKQFAEKADESTNEVKIMTEEINTLVQKTK
jgi:hypothetical protein